MRCHDAIELFTQYRDGDLDAATRSALEAHLAACARCRDEFAALDAICASLRAVPTEPVPAEFVSGVRARLQAPAERPRAVLLRWALPAGAAAVLVVVAFGVFSIVPRTGGVRAPAATDRAKGPVEALRAGDDLRLDAGPARRGGGREEQGRPPSGGPDDSVAGTAGVKAPSSAPADQAQRATRERVDRAAADREDYSTLKAPVAAGRVTAPEEPPPAPPPPAAIAEKPVRDAPAVLRIGERVIRPETPSKLRAAPEAPGAEQPSAATPDVPEDSTPPAPDRSGFFERARAASLNLSAQATRTQRAAGNLTLQLETDEEIEYARVALRPAPGGERETVLWQGKLAKLVSNAIDVKVPPRGVGDAGPGAQQLVVTGTRMTPQAYYVFSPVGPHVEAAAEELEGRKLRGGKAAPAKPLWDVVLQNVALQQGIYVLAPSGFPVREPAGTDAQPSERALATALKRMGYEARPQEGAITIEPVAPGRAAPGQTRRRRG